MLIDIGRKSITVDAEGAPEGLVIVALVWDYFGGVVRTDPNGETTSLEYDDVIIDNFNGGDRKVVAYYLKPNGTKETSFAVSSAYSKGALLQRVLTVTLSPTPSWKVFLESTYGRDIGGDGMEILLPRYDPEWPRPNEGNRTIWDRIRCI